MKTGHFLNTNSTNTTRSFSNSFIHSNLYLNSECIEVETSFTMQPNETTITKMKALRHKKMPKRNLHKSDDKDLKHNKITIKM